LPLTRIFIRRPASRRSRLRFAVLRACPMASAISRCATDTSIPPRRIRPYPPCVQKKTESLPIGWSSLPGPGIPFRKRFQFPYRLPYLRDSFGPGGVSTLASRYHFPDCEPAVVFSLPPFLAHECGAAKQPVHALCVPVGPERQQAVQVYQMHDELGPEAHGFLVRDWEVGAIPSQVSLGRPSLPPGAGQPRSCR